MRLFGKRHERDLTPPAIDFVPPPEPWPGWPTGWATQWDQATENRALRSAVVYRCVDILSGAIASLPLRQFDTERNPITPPASWVTNPEPSLYSSRRDAVSAAVVSLALRGNLFLYVTAFYDTGYPARWVVLNPDAVTVRLGTGGEPIYEINGDQIPLSRLYHLRHLTQPGSLLGVGPLSAALSHLMSLAAEAEVSADLMGKGMIPQGILEHPEELSSKQSADLRADWESNPGQIKVLSGGLAFKALALTPRDTLLMERMDFDSRAIATAFGIPAQMLNIPTEGTGLHYSSSEMDLRSLWQLTLNPIADNLERGMSAMLPRTQTVEFDEYAYLSGNFAEQVAAATALVSSGIWTLNEAREKFRLPEIEEPEPEPIPEPLADAMNQETEETVPLRSVN